MGVDNNMTWGNWRYTKQNISSSDSILEVGCGIGTFWNSITDVDRNIKLTLTDVSNSTLEMCKKNVSFENAEFLQANVMSLSFEQHSFNHLICDFVLHQVLDIENALGELKRVVKKSGSIGIATFSLEHKLRYWDIANKIDSTIGYPLQKEMERFCENNASGILREKFDQVSAQVWESLSRPQDSVSITNFFRILLEKGAEINRPQSFFDDYEKIIRDEIDQEGYFEVKDKLVLYLCN